MGRRLEKGIELPKEHGYWVMMPAALVAASARVNFDLGAIVAALLLAVFTTALGGMLHRRIRRLEWAQLASSVALAGLVLPVELIGGGGLRTALLDALAWASLFACGSLTVRACFARARRRSRAAPYYGAAALLLAAGSCVYLLLRSACASASVSGAAFVLAAAMVVLRPMPKELKTVGITLAVVVIAALVLQVTLGRMGY